MAEASLKNAKRGLVYLRSLPIRQSYAIVRASFKKLSMKPPYWEEYLLMLSSHEYAKAKAMNCVCTYCRSLIYESFSDLSTYINLIQLPTDVRDEYKRWVQIAQRYLSVEYTRDIKEESPCAFTCTKAALSTANNFAFYEPCTHDVLEMSNLKTMDMLAQEQYGRDAEPDDWDAECYNCDKASGKFFPCEGCATVSCRTCIDQTFQVTILSSCPLLLPLFEPK